jgi:AraC-type DNA-binding domain-containing proteins
MPVSIWEEKIKPLQKVIMKPVVFNNLVFTLVDALPARHDEDWVVDSHRHPWFEFNHVSSGALITEVDGKEFIAREGQLYLIPPGVFHSHRHYNYSGDDGFCLRWQLEIADIAKTQGGTGVNPLAEELIYNLSILRPESYDSGIDKIIEQVSIYDENLIHTDLLRCILYLHGKWQKNEKIYPTENLRDNILVRQALLYLSEYYNSDLSVKDIADSLNISYRQLARIFKKITGLTIIEKLIDIRIGKAKELLINTDKLIREIALEVGFTNEFYFSSMFTQYTLTTPSKFREQKRS